MPVPHRDGVERGKGERGGGVGQERESRGGHEVSESCVDKRLAAKENAIPHARLAFGLFGFLIDIDQHYVRMRHSSKKLPNTASDGRHVSERLFNTRWGMGAGDDRVVTKCDG